jgi:hypothetical protein
MVIPTVLRSLQFAEYLIDLCGSQGCRISPLRIHASAENVCAILIFFAQDHRN